MSTRRPAGRGVVFDVPVLGGPHPPPTEQPCDPDDDVACAGPDRGYARHAVAAPALLSRRAPLRRASDARLVQLARAGDQRAFEMIVERYRPLLLAHCRSVAGEAGQDAVQQAFMTAWPALLGRGAVHHLRAWLFAIAHRAALQALHDQGAPVEALGRERAGARSPEEHLEQATHVRETLAAVAGLPPRERDALVWTSIQGRSGSDIARELGVSETAARQLVFRARARARAAVGALVPPLLTDRLPALVGHSARRALALAHGALADTSAIEASGALVRLAPVLAAGALLAAPVAAVELGGRRDARPPARAAKGPAPAGQGWRPAGRGGAGPSRASRAARPPRRARATPAPRPAQLPRGAPAGPSEGANWGVPASARSAAQAAGPEQRAGVASPELAGGAPEALAASPSGNLIPIGVPARPGLAGVTEAPGSGVVAAAGGAQSATGEEGPLGRGAGPVHAPTAGAAPHTSPAGAAAPSTDALR